MYESFYNLKEKPFDLHPDPEYLFMSQGHDNAYTHLEYAIAENKGFVIITGEIGSGKTTLINFFLHKIKQDIQIGLINNTFAPLRNFTKMICQEFELDVEGMDKVGMLDLFHEFLLKQFARQKRVVLIIDEAQNLTPEAMEEIRMISNLEAEKHYLIQMILVGQPELKYKLQRRDLEQFAQRVTVHCHLGPLNREETFRYIRHRLKVAGAPRQNIFRKSAIEVIFKYSGGIPRLINILCDTALVYAYADTRKTVDKKIVENVIRAREAGGIFSAEPFEAPATDSAGGASAPAQAAGISEQAEKELRIMGQRISLLENTVDHMARRLNELSKTRDQRDDVILELFKMLKSSMESRVNTLAQLNHLRKKIYIAQKKAEKNRSKQNSPFFLRLSGKKNVPK
ncbi:MAG: general secretion pathway protein GspA [Deltaproteobacteria bacterium]|nr:MAG: general secretion pathway protein GspA [Deltaproteobacteria bacterium]